jgi:amino acid adenylation domain-containing protein
VLITEPDLAGKLPESTAKIIKPDAEWDVIAQESQANPAIEISADNLCYVIYTSGSTGRPKGVMISHRGLANYLKWSTNAYRVSKGGGAPVHSAIGADLTITGLFAPLLVGRSVTLVPEGFGVQALSDVLQSEKNFSLTKITPAHLEVLGQLIDSEQAAGQTRALIVGGEALRGEQLSFWQTHAPSTRLINEYGPTETVVGCCVYEVPPGIPISGPVPIGRPITNTQLYVLDQYLQPVPVGVTGELYIGGAGVARGYLDRPELTAERFVPNMFGRKPGTRLYKTGDLVRYLPDGNIEFLNRNDQQVKIRGHRIELREVETRVSQHPQINECVVLAKESTSGEKRLVAFITTKPDAPSVSELRGFVAETLPEHMIPSTYVFLDAFPLTPNGKVDQQALTVPEAHGSADALSMPGTPTEEVLIGIWSGILGVNQIGVHDHFLELGGHSLLATQGRIANPRDTSD